MSASDPVLEWLDKVLGPLPTVRKGKEHSRDVEAMRRDRTMHVTTPVFRAFCEGRMTEAQSKVVSRHIRRCRWCSSSKLSYQRLMRAGETK